MLVSQHSPPLTQVDSHRLEAGKHFIRVWRLWSRSTKINFFKIIKEAITQNSQKDQVYENQVDRLWFSNLWPWASLDYRVYKTL